MEQQLKLEMNFCRFCGAPLTPKTPFIFNCPRGHIIFYDASSAASLVLLNDQNEVLFSERAIEPAKGMLGIPGGFCDGFETLEDALAREVREEVGLTPDQYTKPQYVCNAMDYYQFGGETRLVQATIFQARVLPGAVPKAGDQSLNPQFVPLAEIKPDDLYFPATRKAIALLQQRQ